MLIEDRIKAFNATTDSKRTYSVDEAKDMLGCSRQLIYKLIKQGCFKAIKVDNTYRIIKISFDKWLDNE